MREKLAGRPVYFSATVIGVVALLSYLLPVPLSAMQVRLIAVACGAAAWLVLSALKARSAPPGGR